MSPGLGRLVAALAPGLALAAWGGAGAALVGAAAGPAGRAALAPVVAGSGALAFGWWLLGSALGGWVGLRLHDRLVAGPARLADATRLLTADPTAPPIAPPAAAAERDLASAINRLAAERADLVLGMARMVEEGSAKIAHERDQLGALMAELEQSVVVCNPEGRILLYNDRARALCRRMSRAPAIAGGAELIGLGRSIHALVDPALIDHARGTVAARVARGATPSARFVTTSPSGHLLRVNLAPVRSDDGSASGFVLLLDDITESYAAGARQDRRLVELTEAGRASLASLQAALDMLDYPDLQAEERDSFNEVIRAEVRGLGERLATIAADASEDLLTRWPLQEMLAADLATAATRRIAAATGREPGRGEVAEDLWLRVDSFAITEALAFLAAGLGDAVPRLSIRRAAEAGGWAHLDLAWPAGTGDELPGGWQEAPVPLAGGGLALSPRDIAERHGGELWLGREGEVSHLRFLLPVAAGDEAAAQSAERPEFYDFDLFAASEAAHALDDQPLDRLAFTVFDTETTGLDPAGGDEIIQVGAVRVVNGRLLRGESLDQLVDPGRSIPEASIPFHGIRPEMVRGQPRIAEVLGALHAFAADTVLVGHNVAFDMRFLQLKEAATGIRFDQPVLDTLLLASVTQPMEGSQSMEAIAGRLGVEVSGRHSAFGDALTTAGIFLRLLPALRERGIVTLREARAACEDSFYARLKY